MSKRTLLFIFLLVCMLFVVVDCSNVLITPFNYGSDNYVSDGHILDGTGENKYEES